MQIREVTLQELDSAFEVVKELRDTLDYNDFEDLVYAMRHQEYTMMGIFEKERLLCFAGFSILVSLAHGRHLYLLDLVTVPDERSKGYGKEMIAYLEDYAKIRGCRFFLLSSGEQRKDAHRFYEREGFKGASKFFIKAL